MKPTLTDESVSIHFHLQVWGLFTTTEYQASMTPTGQTEECFD